MKALDAMLVCMTCGSPSLAVEPIKEQRRIAGVEFQATFVGRRCLQCGQTCFEGTDMYWFELGVAERLAASSASSADAIEWMASTLMAALNVDLAGLASIMQVEESALLDYVEGRRQIDPCVRALLAVLVMERAEAGDVVLNRLKHLMNPAVIAGVVVVEPPAAGDPSSKLAVEASVPPCPPHDDR